MMTKSALTQILLLVSVVSLGFWLYDNLQTNLTTLGQGIGFSTLESPAGFPIAEALPLPIPGLIELGLFAAIISSLLLPSRRDSSHESSRCLRTLTLVICTWMGLRLLTGEWSSIRFETYSPDKSYFLALAIGLLNTIKVGLAGLVLASLIGFPLGVSRLSTLPEIRMIAASLVHILRSVPVLLQLIFWYVVILNFFPLVQNSYRFFQRQSDTLDQPLHSIYLNNRGLFLPQPEFGGQAAQWLFLILCLLLCVGALRYWKSRTQFRYSKIQFNARAGMMSIIALAGISTSVAFGPLDLPQLDYPRLTFGGRNIASELTLTPEYLALVLGLGIYTSSFIGEIVRGGILSVDQGQKEAAKALGLSGWQSLRLVIMPQAWRVIAPPLTSQYLNLVKNSSLAVAVGYPDLVGVGGTILNQSGRSLEIILIWMAVYLLLSLSISAMINIMQNRQNRREGRI